MGQNRASFLHDPCILIIAYVIHVCQPLYDKFNIVVKTLAKPAKTVAGVIIFVGRGH